jgi:GT2 family glycosyltransferase
MSFSVVIPSGSLSNLAACVRSIREAGETCRIIVVSNGLDSDRLDRDASPVMNRETISMFNNRVDFTDGAIPFVFARNANIGIRMAGSDDIILMGDDCMLKTPHGFTALSAAMEDHKRLHFGITSAALNFVGNRNQYPLSHINLHVPAFRDEPRMLCFPCVYIPHSTIERVGLMDERFVDYGFDDDDYSWRVREAGLKLGVWDGCYVDHRKLPSFWRTGATAETLGLEKNLKRFIEKWGLDNHGLSREKSPFAHLFPAIT